MPEADRILGRRAQYTLDQFKPIARFTADPTVLVVRSGRCPGRPDALLCKDPRPFQLAGRPDYASGISELWRFALRPGLTAA